MPTTTPSTITNTEALTILDEYIENAERSEIVEPDVLEALNRAFQALQDVVEQEGCR
jgi:hypothetical protein